MAAFQRSPFIYVGGCKGGTGKSFSTMLVADIVNNPIIIDMDSTTGDVLDAFKNSGWTDVLHIPARSGDDYYELVGLVEDQRDRVVLVSAPAGDLDPIKEAIPFLDAEHREGRPMVFLWMVDGDNKGVGNLDTFLDALTSEDSAITVHMVLNHGRGSRRELAQVRRSQTVERLQKRGGRVVELRKLVSPLGLWLLKHGFTLQALREGQKVLNGMHAKLKSREATLGTVGRTESLRVFGDLVLPDGSDAE